MSLRLQRVAEGWAAVGKGWAVLAPTKDEALRLFEEAERTHEQIDQRGEDEQAGHA